MFPIWRVVYGIAPPMATPLHLVLQRPFPTVELEKPDTEPSDQLFELRRAGKKRVGTLNPMRPVMFLENCGEARYLKQDHAQISFLSYLAGGEPGSFYQL